MINGTDTQKLRDVIDDFWMQATGAPYAPADVANQFLERMEEAFYDAANRFNDFQLDVELKGGNYEITTEIKSYDPDFEVVFYKSDLKDTVGYIRSGIEELEACRAWEQKNNILDDDDLRDIDSAIESLNSAISSLR